MPKVDSDSLRRKVIVLCPVRNELANLKRVLPIWELFADHIILADQSSEDGTQQYVSGHEKVTIVHNDSDGLDEIARNRVLLEAARAVSKDAIHLYLDADEILSANVLKAPEWRSFCGQEEGTVGVFQWIQLWRTPFRYINSGILAPGPYNIAFIDDGREIEGTKRIHEQRGVGVQNPKRTFHFNEVVCLHYAWVAFEKAVRRNYWYKALWVTKGSTAHYLTNRNHNWYLKVRDNNLANTPKRWLADYKERGLDVTSWEGSRLYWWDVDILRWFERYGTERFRWLDIWRDVDWEELRQRAIEEGYTGLPDRPVSRPGKGILVYHAISAEGFGYLCRIAKSATRRLAARVLP